MNDEKFEAAMAVLEEIKRIILDVAEKLDAARIAHEKVAQEQE